MTENLEKRLGQAREAAARMQELSAVRQLAEELPLLERQLQLEQARQRAQGNLARAKARAKERLTQAKPRVKEWRERFETLTSEMEQLMNDLPQIGEPIFQSGREVRSAAREIAALNPEWDDLGPLSADDMEIHWHEIGGDDPELTILSDQPRSPFRIRLIAHLKPWTYVAAAWHRFF